jgi:hypothetical protein
MLGCNEYLAEWNYRCKVVLDQGPDFSVYGIAM